MTDSMANFEENLLDSPTDESSDEIIEILLCVKLILKIMLNLIIMLGAFFLMYVLHKFKRLHTRSNSYLWHYAIWSLLFYTLAIVYDILEHFLVKNFISCAVFQMKCVSLHMYMIFVSLMGIDWFISIFDNKFCQFYRDHYKYLIGGLYLLFFVKYFLYTVSDCLGEQTKLDNFTVVLYFILLFAVGVTNLWVRFKVCTQEELKGKHTLKISTVFLYFGLVVQLIHLANMLGCNLSEKAFYYKISESVAEHGTPFWVFYKMRKLDSHFDEAWKVVLPRFCIGRSSENSDDDEEDIVSTTA